MAAQTSRRQRLRAATVEEIRAAARDLLVTKGSAAVTINAVAREVGMSGPALYHYFANHDALISAVTTDFYRELAETLEGARDAVPAEEPMRRLLATCRALRGWATTHTAEFGWIFASPFGAANHGHDSERSQAGNRFERIFLDQFVELWRARPFPAPSPDCVDPALHAQHVAYAARHGDRLPPAAVHVFLTCWTRIYGTLCMEMLHQLDFAYWNMTPVFEQTLHDLCATLGHPYEPPDAE
ncbi:TetR/AcrR family transcriptional regulator [Spiractinospora alimapuensis]|uniref:TetR/AcrR family transcriptional regulator n=1 Tax=Spiractinospora alimapuensis TaxID=2820884 RepID=UPI001F225498|nr:TetR/AcrR family transcriptional regulator [Spiractinospora alimapuensis]QVQ52830.1 TetR/AcrR family transcriptional regulator [Spiractinospora alimapuensis]